MNTTLRLLSLTAVLLLQACATLQPEPTDPPSPAAPAFRPAIEAANKQLMDLYNKGDKAGVARMYEDTALMLSDRGSRFTGRAAIDAYWNPPSKPDSKPGKWTLEIISLDGNANMPIQRGRSILEMPGKEDKPHISDVQFIVVWRKQPDSSYKIAVDAWWPTPK